ncbi:uncharacterized protein EI90DRAFT_3014217 [Cantharellus anzutake]|uniref:uncharacterized protein n=1 Tax=Cantharellus anzutake TaxID=1750568 RepID=UPI001902DCF3|nr:uncharacterized protein EI90DRAFT_3014217 [Cantharellus anzutake]KAF8336480.1 hypothetical protein EI90DRAFT_3014217 [Cantharellus anzutake]
MEEMMIIVGGIGTTKNKARIHGNKSWARVRGMGDVCEIGDGFIVLGIKGATDAKNMVQNVLEDLHTYGFEGKELAKKLIMHNIEILGPLTKKMTLRQILAGYRALKLPRWGSEDKQPSIT